MKRMLLTVILFISIISMPSCSDREKNTDTLTLYMIDDYNIQNAVEKFNETHKNNLINTQKFYREQKEELSGRLQYELCSGEGPDIILMESDTLPELSKYMENGVFYDVNEFMKKDRKFDINDFNSKLMEYGMYNGKRYVVPLFYKINAFFTTDEILKKNNIDAGSIFLGMNKTVDIASMYVLQKQDKTGRFFSPLDFSYFLDMSNGLVDIEKKKANFNCSEFVKLLETYKQLYEASKKDVMYDKYKDGLGSDLLKNEETVMNLQEISCLKTLWSCYYSFTEEVTPDVRVITSDGGRHAAARPVLSAAINSKCKNKKAAYEFIRLLLSEEYQENASVYYLPINLKAYETQKDIFLRGNGGNDYRIKLRNGGINSDSSARKIISDIDEITSAIDSYGWKDYKIYELIEEKLNDFLKGEISAGDAAKAIQEKVQAYMDSPLTKMEGVMASNDKEIKKIKLKLYYPRYFTFAENALHTYKNKYKNVDVEVEEAKGDIKTKLVTDLMSGEGPDVFLYPPSFFNLHKIISGGTFSSLDELMLNDKDFNLTDYNVNVFKSGIYGWKRYCLPLCFNLQFMYTTTETLENNNIQYDSDNWTWDEFVNKTKAFMKNRKNEDQYFLRYSSLTDIRNLIMNCSKAFVDYENKKTYFNSNEFLEIMNIYKELYPTKEPDKIEQNDADIYSMKSFIFDKIGAQHSWSGICSTYSQIMKYKAEEMKVIPIPTFKWDSGKSLVAPTLIAAVYSNCKNKQAAFNYIKILLSKDIQKKFIADFPYSMPVNKAAYEEEKSIYSSEKAVDLYPLSFKAVPLSAGVTAAIDSLVKNAELSAEYDFNVWSLIQDEADAYIQGKKSAKEAAKEIDRKVTLILNE